jgi:hypothetical protein
MFRRLDSARQSAGGGVQFHPVESGLDGPPRGFAVFRDDLDNLGSREGARLHQVLESGGGEDLTGGLDGVGGDQPGAVR